MYKVCNESIMNKPDSDDKSRFIFQAAADDVEVSEGKEVFDMIPNQTTIDAMNSVSETGSYNSFSEVLADIDTTPQQVESLGKPEWKNGDIVVFGKDDRDGIYIAYDAYNEGHVVYSGGVYFHVLDGDFSKPETPAEREESERWEAAHYLYCKCGIQHETVSFEKFKAGDDCYACVWLDIVDETGYRKKEDK